MNSNRAIIPIQELNCQQCAITLANKLSRIKYISHLEVYYNSSEVCFNFQNIKGVAAVENMLSEFGFNPLGETVKPKQSNGLFCKDTSTNFCINIS